MKIRIPLEITRFHSKTIELYCGLFKQAYEVANFYGFYATIDQMKGMIRGDEEAVSHALNELKDLIFYEDGYIEFEDFSEPYVDLPYWALCRIFEDRGENVGRLLKFYILAIGVLDKEKKIWDWDDIEEYRSPFYLARCIGLGIVEYIPRDDKSWFRIPEREG